MVDSIKSVLMKRDGINEDEAEAVAMNEGYKACLKDLKKWLLKDNTDEHISSVYKFIEEREKK